MVAAIVSSLAMAWGVGEVLGLRRTLESEAARAPWFIVIYAACIITSVVLVWEVPDLVWLNIATQVANAFMLPLMVGMLLVLANRALPPAHQLRGVYLWLFLALAVATSCVGLWGGAAIFM
jgi:Mn2+/Fe2+ NRAMP family transporter